jgi:hypothetical protein
MRASPFLTGAFAGVMSAALATASPLTNPLTADQVSCDELQLERLALRATVVERLSGVDDLPMVNHPSLFLWRSSEGGGGAYSALAVSDGIMGPLGDIVRAETQLALDLTLHAAADPLNPTAQLLPQATLVQRQQDSNLIVPTYLAPYLKVTFALEPNSQSPFAPLIPLVANNLAAATNGDQPTAHADAAGRGIKQDSLTSSCENLLTAFDQQIFTILSRTVRVSECGLDVLDTTINLPCDQDGSAFNITLFRGEDPQTYRADVYLYSELCEDTCTFGVEEKVAFEFQLNWDAFGNLTTGEVTVLPSCPGSPISCVYGGGYPLFVLPPLWAGHSHQGQHVLFDVGVRVGNDYPLAPLVPQAAINWQVLLARSAWN